MASKARSRSNTEKLGLPAPRKQGLLGRSIMASGENQPADESNGRFCLCGGIAVPLGLASVVILLLFGLTEWAKSRWADNLGWDMHLVVSQGRDVITAVIIGLVAGWMIICKSPALLSATSLSERVSAGDASGERIRLYAQWFIAMRWIAFVVTGVLIYISIPVLGLLPRESLVPLVSLAVVMAASNLFYVHTLRRRWNAQRLLLVQAYVDLLLLTVLLHYSGGIENPLSGLMLFHVIIGGILLAHRECYRIAAVGSLLYGTLALAEASGWIPHYGLEMISHRSIFGQSTPVALHLPYAVTLVLLHSVILFLTAYFVSTLAERLRKNEEALTCMAKRTEEDRSLLVQALETTNTGLRVLTTDLKPAWTNGRWQEWFGLSNDCCEMFPEAEGCPAADCLEKGSIHVMEMQQRTEEDGKERVRHFHVTSAPIRDSRGGVIRVVQLVQDITDRKEANDRMMRAGQMAAVGELAGQVAHEVNNPIAIISAKARLLLSNRRGEMSDKIASDLEKITGLTQRVARIAQGLLSYCRPSPASRHRIDICQPIRGSLAMVEERTASMGIEIVDALPREGLFVTANGSEIEQVFLNLFLNAIQAMSERGGKLRISAGVRNLMDSEAEAVRPFAEVAVDDSGPGVDASLRERIFEPFFTTKAEVQGTGLGLSICQGLIRSHGGAIRIENAPLGGARFLVRLPLAEKKARK